MSESNVAEVPIARRETADAFARVRTGLTYGNEQGIPCQPGPSSWSEITLRVHARLDEVEEEWRAFEQRADCTAFQTFDRLAKWQRHIGARNHAELRIVLGRDSGGELLFILPLAVESRGLIRRLTWLGSELSDYNAPLLADTFLRRLDLDQFVLLWRRIVTLLRADRFDLIDLQKMPETIGAQRNPFLALNVRANPSGAYLADLGHDWERFYAARRSSSTRRRERRQLKQLAAQGEIRFVDVKDQRDIERTLDTLFGQKAQAFASMGVDDVFARPGYRAFLLDLATDPSSRELIHVSRLDVGSTIAAASLGLRFRSRYYLVLSSYQHGELSRFGPGRAHLHNLLNYAIDHGFGQFDFTIGDEPYKRDWADFELRLYDHLAATTIRGWPVVAGTAVFRRAKRFIKQSSTLWRAFSKARALAGLIGTR